MEKTCLLHGCLPSHCNCPPNIALAETLTTERVVNELPFIIKLSAEFDGKTISEEDIKKKYLIVEHHRRIKHGSEHKLISYTVYTGPREQDDMVIV